VKKIRGDESSKPKPVRKEAADKLKALPPDIRVHFDLAQPSHPT